MSSLCDEQLSPCVPHDVNRELSADGYEVVTHDKSRAFTVEIGGYTIPLQTRERHFSIRYDENWEWSGLTIVVDQLGYAEDCGTKTGSSNGSISEDAIFTDSEIVYLDHINNIAIWRELRQECKFQLTTDRIATFKVAYGTFYAHWFEVIPVIQQVERWYTLVNGVLEEIDSEESEIHLPPYNILWPKPPSLASPSDAPATFYDYNAGDLELAELDGGKDFYYPDWLRMMGIDKSVDQAEAEDRFNAYFLSAERSETEVYPMPKLGYARPWGNAAKDAEGNILLSCRTKNKTVNKLYLNDEDKTVIDLNTTGILEGESLKLYPVGLI